MDKKTIVLTLYGNKTNISDFSINLFDGSDHWDSTPAQDFCNNKNELELKDDNWVYAAIIKENEKTKLVKPGTIDFDILSSLDDHSIQRVLREIDSYVLYKALRSANKDIYSAVLRNMTKRAAMMLIEDMDYMGPIRLSDIQEARRSIVALIRHMEDTGEIVIPKSSKDQYDNS